MQALCNYFVLKNKTAFWRGEQESLRKPLFVPALSCCFVFVLPSGFTTRYVELIVRQPRQPGGAVQEVT